MLTDVVFWGTLISSILFITAAVQYGKGIIKKKNNYVQDAYLTLLFLALFSNYTYLCFARVMMYNDYDRFMFLLVRTTYVPPVYLVVVVMAALVINKALKKRK